MTYKNIFPRLFFGATAMALFVMSAPLLVNASEVDKINPQDPLWTNPYRAAWSAPKYEMRDRVTNGTPADRGIKESIDQAIPNFWVKSHSEHGIVTLTGEVDSIEERDEYISLARGIPGVQRVNAKMAIDDPYWGTIKSSKRNSFVHNGRE